MMNKEMRSKRQSARAFSVGGDADGSTGSEESEPEPEMMESAEMIVDDAEEGASEAGSSSVPFTHAH